MGQLNFRLIILVTILALFSMSGIVYSSGGVQTKMLSQSTDPSSLNPNVSCSASVVTIFDITDNKTKLSSYNNSPFSPGITPPATYSNALQVDGSSSNSAGSSTSISVTLSTTNVNDVIYLAIGSNKAQSSYTVKDNAGLSWTIRKHISTSPDLATYAAISSSALKSDTITVTASTSASLNVFVFGITGADTQSFADAFDENKAVPSHNSGTGSTLSTKISTYSYNDMLIGVGVQLNGRTLSAVSPFTMIGGGSSKTLGAENHTVSTWESNFPIKFTSTGTGAWVMIGDAVSRDGGPDGGGAKRWLTNALGNAPTGWVSPGPACTITNLKGVSEPSFVQIDNVKVSALKISRDCSTNYDLINGGTSMGGTFCDYVFNAYDPSVNPSKCTSPSSPACYGIIHVEIDQDWQGAGYFGYCGSTCSPSSLVTLIKAHPNAEINIQGFVYWDPEAINSPGHSFSGWEIHPMTSWVCVLNC